MSKRFHVFDTPLMKVKCFKMHNILNTQQKVNRNKYGTTRLSHFTTAALSEDSHFFSRVSLGRRARIQMDKCLFILESLPFL